MESGAKQLPALSGQATVIKATKVAVTIEWFIVDFHFQSKQYQM